LDIINFEDVRLIKIWNPIGKEEDSNGKYAEKSEYWYRELLEHFKYKRAKGILFVSFEENIKHFARTYICKNQDDFFHRTLKSKAFYGKNSDLKCNFNNNYEIERKKEDRIKIKSKIKGIYNFLLLLSISVL